MLNYLWKDNLDFNGSGYKNYFKKKKLLVAIDDAKNGQLNSLLIQMDEGVHFAKDEPVGAVLL